ncbi:hypothetical protein BS50DRAFT_245814 [Corynespora cassiicola Philippines]|uniref:LITAF domain-containing protein n=1 Tax=Corynespora cassiicola Philippines TaxID=1448308 RepID=A0A2T2P3F3_CORCC|nr:hypothetical protein BS50DRAFT_245814 [Corynespora cassiicola Philippines]
MGLPTDPQDAAPAYDDVFEGYSANPFAASGSTSAYRPVLQDDVELHAHDHHSPSPAPATQPETLAQTIAGVFRQKPHTHCEQCDLQLAARERRANERHCCTMVAATFMVGFAAFVILAVVVSDNMAKTRRHH